MLIGHPTEAEVWRSIAARQSTLQAGRSTAPDRGQSGSLTVLEGVAPMAFFPCSNHHAPYRGPSNAAYPAIVNGTTAERGKLRMCSECFADYVSLAHLDLVQVVDRESAERTPGCFKCGVDAATEALESIFVTVYPRGSEPLNYYGRVCAEHRPQAVAQFLLK